MRLQITIKEARADREPNCAPLRIVIRIRATQQQIRENSNELQIGDLPFAGIESSLRSPLPGLAARRLTV